jgi:hypothetical protein
VFTITKFENIHFPWQEEHENIETEPSEENEPCFINNKEKHKNND